MNYNGKALPQHVIEKMSSADRKELGLMTDAEKVDKNASRLEAEIQKDVEAYLKQLGYFPRTPHDILRGMPRAGWYIHVHKAKRNPIILDLLILSHSGQYLELELKTNDGRVRDEQAALLSYGNSALAREAMPAFEIIKEWHENQIAGREGWRRITDV